VILAVTQPEPGNLPVAGVDDHDLPDIVSRVERELVPGLIAWREDLEDERGRRQPDAGCARPVQPPIGDAEVLLGLAEVELADRGREPGGARQRTQLLGELLADLSVLEGRAGNHVEHTLPDLVEMVDARAAAPLDQSFKLRRWAAEHKRCHRSTIPPGRATPIRRGRSTGCRTPAPWRVDRNARPELA
jgi:hypothetical protein